MITSGSWRTMMPQPARERQADLRIHLDLVDAVHLVFHRIFDRDDLLVRQVDALRAREYSVVDLPLPVGPVTRKMPCGMRMKCSMRDSMWSSKPSRRRS